MSEQGFNPASNDEHDALFASVQDAFASPTEFDVTVTMVDNSQPKSIEKNRRLMTMLRVFVGQTSQAFADLV